MNPVILPYSAESGDLCGRCACAQYPVVAMAHYSNHWAIKVCSGCLTKAENSAMASAHPVAGNLGGLVNGGFCKEANG